MEGCKPASMAYKYEIDSGSFRRDVRLFLALHDSPLLLHVACDADFLLLSLFWRRRCGDLCFNVFRIVFFLSWLRSKTPVSFDSISFSDTTGKNNIKNASQKPGDPKNDNSADTNADENEGTALATA